jgi:hypothetical protein
MIELDSFSFFLPLPAVRDRLELLSEIQDQEIQDPRREIVYNAPFVKKSNGIGPTFPFSSIVQHSINILLARLVKLLTFSYI